jgi:hypothetical protein
MFHASYLMTTCVTYLFIFSGLFLASNPLLPRNPMGAVLLCPINRKFMFSNIPPVNADLLSLSFRAIRASISNCRLPVSPDRHLISGLAGAWEALFAYDTLVFGLTLYKTYNVSRQRDLGTSDLSLTALLLRDGK